ncbi:MAG: glutamine-hydrolyzing carbamoyl-phosphate synthase small subunit [Anaeroplasma sp.]
MKNRKLVLEDGSVFEGIGFGSNNEVIAEIRFNTSVVGYQEILSDQANCQQIICMAYPLIGNYGLTDEDYETRYLTAKGIIVREYNDLPSNFRFTHKLSEVMDEEGIPGIYDVDTREIVRKIRDNGILKGMICDINKSINECLDQIRNYCVPTDLIRNVSSKKVWYSRTTNPIKNVVVIDCGIKQSIIKMLNNIGCNVIVVPYNYPLDSIIKLKPDGLLISDGPGDPNTATEVINLIKQLRSKLPILGIGLGQEIIGIAYGAKAVKEKVGHNGSNLPVKNLKTGKIEITSQNDTYILDSNSLNCTGLMVTHINLLDNCVEGIMDEENSVLAVKYSPSEELESDEYVFNKFVKLMKDFGGNSNAKKNRY